MIVLRSIIIFSVTESNDAVTFECRRAIDNKHDIKIFSLVNEQSARNDNEDRHNFLRSLILCNINKNE